MMNQGDVAPPTSYKVPVVRKAKQQQRDKKLSIPAGCHPVINLVKMKHAIPHAGSIHEISMDKFHVHYWSPSQLLIYRQYVGSSYSVLIADATGRLVHRLITPGGNSGHIFLYLGVVRIGEITLPVVQMLSEKQDTSTIVFWINEWQRSGAPTPNEVWIGNSPALKSAFARTLCKCSDLANYKDKCWNALTNQGPPPDCFLRLDVAHYISRAAKWRLWREKSTARLKEFYLRSLGLLVKCKTIKALRQHLKAVTLLANSPNVGVEDEESPVVEARRFLSEKMKGLDAKFAVEEIDIDPFYDNEEDEEEGEEVSTRHSNEEDGESTSHHHTNHFIASIKNEVKNLSPEEGNGEPNPYYAPEVAQKFYKLGVDFPLWSAVMVEKFKSPHETAASAPVEGAFKKLKTDTLEGKKVLLRADKFLSVHLLSIDGACKLAGATEMQELASNTSAESSTARTANNNAKHKQGSSSGAKKAVVPASSEQSSKRKRSSHDQVVAPPQDSSDDSDVEEEGPCDLSNVENWMNLSDPPRSPKPPKRKKVSKYLDPFPEMQALSDAEKLKPPKRQLLWNGNKTGFITTAESTRVHISNTCAFDCMAQMISNAYLNYPKYRATVDSSKNRLMSTGKSLALEGAVNQTYKLRCEALTEVLPPTSTLPKFSAKTRTQRCSVLALRYDCMSDPPELATMLLEGDPSYAIQNDCTCSAQGRKEVPVLDAFEVIEVEDGIKNLKKAIHLSLGLNKDGVHHGFCVECDAEGAAKVIFGPHLIVNVDIYSAPGRSGKKRGNTVSTLTVPLVDIPTTLRFGPLEYLLVGAIHRSGDHLVAYTKNSDGLWRMYDDLQKKPLTVDEKKVAVSPVIFMYIQL
ncbi:hypothetical protein ONE63_011542 [Megalurothrips usitatus]|uniref:USP domain-containing protein n=1 Tax=Megalurothrips usitatus TaxID=439358 RepID=A0AAV7X230_9NEOP|nr:hypothetical protein ONE63_011542 [Megalurothrips usitatus]